MAGEKDRARRDDLHRIVIRTGGLHRLEPVDVFMAKGGQRGGRAGLTCDPSPPTKEFVRVACEGRFLY